MAISSRCAPSSRRAAIASATLDPNAWRKPRVSFARFSPQARAMPSSVNFSCQRSSTSRRAAARRAASRSDSVPAPSAAISAPAAKWVKVAHRSSMLFASRSVLRAGSASGQSRIATASSARSAGRCQAPAASGSRPNSRRHASAATASTTAASSAPSVVTAVVQIGASPRWKRSTSASGGSGTSATGPVPTKDSISGDTSIRCFGIIDPSPLPS